MSLLAAAVQRPLLCRGYPLSDLSFLSQLHKSLFPDSEVPGFGAAYSSLWEVLRQRVSLPMMRALEQMLSLPRGEA